MTSTTIVSAVQLLSDKLTSNIDVTSVPTTLGVPIPTITSMLEKAISVYDMNHSHLATITDNIIAQSLEKRMLLGQAAINYYSILNDIASATTTSPGDFTHAASASAIMKTMFADLANFDGNFPSVGGNAALVAVFSIILALQILLGVFYHQWWFLSCWVIGVGMEIIGYGGRIWIHFDMFSKSAYIMQTICVTLAPCFLLAGMYYVLAQLSHIYGEQYSFFRPIVYSYTFTICDVFSLFIQGAGGGLSSKSSNNPALGINIMVGGLAFQVFTMSVFQYLWYSFIWKIYQTHKQFGDSKFNPDFARIRSRTSHMALFCLGFSFSFFFIYVRSIYRLIEMCEGWDSKLVNKEIYFMILEGLMISLSCVLMTVFHPGLAYGRESHIYIDKKFKGFLSNKNESYELKHNNFDNFEMRDAL